LRRSSTTRLWRPRRRAGTTRSTSSQTHGFSWARGCRFRKNLQATVITRPPRMEQSASAGARVLAGAPPVAHAHGVVDTQLVGFALEAHGRKRHGRDLALHLPE